MSSVEVLVAVYLHPGRSPRDTIHAARSSARAVERFRNGWPSRQIAATRLASPRQLPPVSSNVFGDDVETRGRMKLEELPFRTVGRRADAIAMRRRSRCRDSRVQVDLAARRSRATVAAADEALDPLDLLRGGGRHVAPPTGRRARPRRRRLRDEVDRDLAGFPPSWMAIRGSLGRAGDQARARSPIRRVRGVQDAAVGNGPPSRPSRIRDLPRRCRFGSKVRADAIAPRMRSCPSRTTSSTTRDAEPCAGIERVPRHGPRTSLPGSHRGDSALGLRGVALREPSCDPASPFRAFPAFRRTRGPCDARRR